LFNSYLSRAAIDGVEMKKINPGGAGGLGSIDKKQNS
jgi:hypothetical protein